MEWIKLMNEAVDYIEAHLKDEISYERADRLAGCSVYHFQRMFSYMASIPLAVDTGCS